MLHTPENSKGKRLVDSRGVEINHAVSFDDATNEVAIVITGTNDNGKNQIVCAPLPCEKGSYNYEVIKTKVIINGAKMVDRKSREWKKPSIEGLKLAQESLQKLYNKEPTEEFIKSIEETGEELDPFLKFDTAQVMRDETSIFADYHTSPYKNFNHYFNDHIVHWKAEIGGDRFCNLYNYLTLKGHIDDSSI